MRSNEEVARANREYFLDGRDFFVDKWSLIGYFEFITVNIVHLTVIMIELFRFPVATKSLEP